MGDPLERCLGYQYDLACNAMNLCPLVPSGTTSQRSCSRRFEIAGYGKEKVEKAVSAAWLTPYNTVPRPRWFAQP